MLLHVILQKIYPTPNIDAILVLASSLLKTDFYAEGLTLDKLGLDKANLDKVM